MRHLGGGQECEILSDLNTDAIPLPAYFTLELLKNDEQMKLLAEKYPTTQVDLYKFFELLGKNLPMPSNNGLCTFNRKCVEKYLVELTKVDPMLSVDVGNLLSKTKYISHERLIVHLNNAFDKFEGLIGNDPFTLVYTDNTISSEYLCIWLLWSRIKKLNLVAIKQYEDWKTQEPSQKVLWVDDAVYSGGNLSELVVRIPKNVHIYAVVGFVSDYLKHTLPLEEEENLTVLASQKLDGYATTDGRISRYFMTHEELPAIYFDHKIAGPSSTFNYVYFGLIPYRPLTEEDDMGDCCPIHSHQRIQILNVVPSREILNEMTLFLTQHWKELQLPTKI
jgi:hypothetical protein